MTQTEQPVLVEVRCEQTGFKQTFSIGTNRTEVVTCLGWAVKAFNKPPHVVPCCLHVHAAGAIVLRVFGGRRHLRHVVRAVLRQGGVYA